MEDHVKIDLGETVYSHQTAIIRGAVSVGEYSSLWPYSVIRSELHYVKIGRRTNIQDHAVLHVGLKHPTIIGNFCSITHHAVIHGASIGDCTLIGIGAIVMDGAEVGRNSIVAANSVVAQDVTFPDNCLIAGTPAKCIKRCDYRQQNIENAEWYVSAANAYSNGHDRF